MEFVLENSGVFSKSVWNSCIIFENESFLDANIDLPTLSSKSLWFQKWSDEKINQRESRRLNVELKLIDFTFFFAFFFYFIGLQVSTVIRWTVLGSMFEAHIITIHASICLILVTIPFFFLRIYFLKLCRKVSGSRVKLRDFYRRLRILDQNFWLNMHLIIEE